MRLFFLQSNYQSVWKTASAKVKSWLQPNCARIHESPEVIDEITKSFQLFQERGVRLLLLSSNNGYEVGEEYIRQVIRKEYNSMKDSGLLSTKVLSGVTSHVKTIGVPGRTVWLSLGMDA